MLSYSTAQKEEVDQSGHHGQGNSRRRKVPSRLWSHPLAGRSSRHRLSRGEDFLVLLPSYLNSSGFDRVTRPCFQSVGVGFWSAPVTHQDQGCGRILKREFLPAPGNLACPRKLSVPRRVQGYRIHRSPGSPFRVSNPNVAHGVGVPSDQIISELSRFQGRSSG